MGISTTAFRKHTTITSCINMSKSAHTSVIIHHIDICIPHHHKNAHVIKAHPRVSKIYIDKQISRMSKTCPIQNENPHMLSQQDIHSDTKTPKCTNALGETPSAANTKSPGTGSRHLSHLRDQISISEAIISCLINQFRDHFPQVTSIYKP